MTPLDAVKVLKKKETDKRIKNLIREQLLDDISVPKLRKVENTQCTCYDFWNDGKCEHIRKPKVEKDYTALILIGLAIIFFLTAFTGQLSGEQLIR